MKRLRCSKCGSGSVVPNRIATNETAARRLRAYMAGFFGANASSFLAQTDYLDQKESPSCKAGAVVADPRSGGESAKVGIGKRGLATRE